MIAAGPNTDPLFHDTIVWIVEQSPRFAFWAIFALFTVQKVAQVIFAMGISPDHWKNNEEVEPDSEPSVEPKTASEDSVI